MTIAPRYRAGTELTQPFCVFKRYRRRTVLVTFAAAQKTEYEVREQKDGRWEVVIHKPCADDIHVLNFATEAGARGWVEGQIEKKR